MKPQLQAKLPSAGMVMGSSLAGSSKEASSFFKKTTKETKTSKKET